MSPKGASSRGDPGPISDISNFSHSLIVVTRKDLCVKPLNFITTNVVVVDKRANVAAMLSDDKDVVNTAILYVFLRKLDWSVCVRRGACGNSRVMV